MRRHRLLGSILILFPLAVLAACSGNQSQAATTGSTGNDAPAQLAFGVNMAQRGLWSEALFRFHQAERLDPDNPRIYNNLAVAYEATGGFEKALEYYQRALRLEPANREARANYARFAEFYQSFKRAQAAKDGADKAAPATVPASGEPPAATEPPAEPPPAAEPPAEPPPAAAAGLSRG